ncbi:MAG TPA: helix-turn-helix domain-containing protein [Ktedonosporobacter sp.]|nr:helix-turn-helix domain-containing protein [Ktedonosporobacter sp.]
MIMPFGTLLKRFRNAAGLTQGELAEKAGYSEGYISKFESGKRAPTREAAERLAQYLFLSQEDHNALMASVTRSLPTSSGHRDANGEDWEGVHVEGSFYGRERELATLKKWVLEDRCHLVAIVGLGGVGKTTLTAALVEQIAEAFDNTLYCSLQHTPPLNITLRQWLEHLSNQGQVGIPENVDQQIHLLIRYLQDKRCLLVLDNFESILDEQRDGHYRNGYEGYGELIQRLGKAMQSCLLLTSREKPKDIAFFVGAKSLIRSFSLNGLEPAEGQQLLEEKGLHGSDETFAELVGHYAGNPLALKLVSAYIYEIFGGDITAFLKQEKTVFGDIYDLLEKQFAPLQEVQRRILYWLAIEREAISFDTLRENMLPFVSTSLLLESLDFLRRRSMIERNKEALFTLQPVIMEYITDSIVERVCQEIDSGSIEVLKSHALLKAQAKDYVRNSQLRVILNPITERLLTALGAEKSANQLKNMLAHIRTMHAQQQGYTAGNILNLLIHMKIDLTGYDFSHLTVRQAYLQHVSLPYVNFASADLTTSVFTDTFGITLSVAFSPQGELLAGGTSSGEIRLWQARDGTPLLTCRGHTEWVRSVTFSPDGKLLASGSEDQTVRLWETETGRCLRVLPGHSYRVWSVAFSPDGKLLASGSEDQTVRLWETETGRCVQVLQGATQKVRSIAFSPDGRLLASGNEDQTIWLWETETGQCLRILRGHTNRIWSIAFSPDGRLLASGSEDQTVRLWETETGRCLRVLLGNTQRVKAIAFSPDGRLLASGNEDQTIWLWETETGQCLRILRGHTNRIWSVAFRPRENVLASSSDDQTVRLWDVSTGLCLKTLRGYSNWVWAVTFSPDGRLLASSSDDQTVRLWDVSSGQCRSTLRGHTNRIWSVAFSLDGKLLASGSEDQTVRLWDVSAGRCLKILQEHNDWVRTVAFSPDERLLASGGDDRTVRLWEISSGRCIKTLQGHGGRVRSVAFSPDGRLLASGNDDQTIRLWDVNTGESSTLYKHTNTVWSVAFSPDGKLLASGSDDQTVILWDVSAAQYLKTLLAHNDWIRSVAFSPDGKWLVYASANEIYSHEINTERGFNVLQGHHGRVRSVAFDSSATMLASGGADETIKIWNIQTGESLKTFISERPYEGMDITDVVGLTETQKATLRALGATEQER